MSDMDRKDLRQLIHDITHLTKAWDRMSKNKRDKIAGFICEDSEVCINRIFKIADRVALAVLLDKAA